MSPSIGIEVRLFFQAFLLGVSLIFLYDFIRIFRNIIKHSKTHEAVEDTIFWIIAGFIVFIMLYQNNDGVIRWFAIAGVSAGMFLYHISISKIFVKYVSMALNKIIRILLKPLAWIFKGISKCVKKLIKVLKKLYKLIKIKRKGKQEKKQEKKLEKKRGVRAGNEKIQKKKKHK